MSVPMPTHHFLEKMFHHKHQVQVHACHRQTECRSMFPNNALAAPREAAFKHLLARIARVGWADLHGLGLRDKSECVLDGVYRIGLCRDLKIRLCVGERARREETYLNVEFE